MNMLHNQVDTFTKVSMSSDITGSIKPNTQDMLMVLFTNGNEEIFI